MSADLIEKKTRIFQEKKQIDNEDFALRKEVISNNQYP